MSMRKALKLLTSVGLVLLLGALLAGCSRRPSSQPGGQTSEKPKDHVTYRLDWLPRGNYAPLFVALDKGYFEQEGIIVDNIVNGDGSVNAVKLVGAGEFTFGNADSPTMVTGKVKGIPVSAIFMINQKSPMAWVSLKEKGITKPKDVEGKTFGVHPAGSTFIFYQAFTKLTGVDRKKVKEVTVGVPYENYLLQKQVDAVNGYIDAEIPELEAKAGGPGSLNIILGSDHGYKVYGTSVIVADKTIKENPDLVRRFVKAYKKGFEFTIKNPEEAVDILVKHRPEAKKEVMLKQLKADIEHTFSSSDTDSHGYGWMTKEGWEATQNVLFDQGVIDHKVDVNSLFATQFLEK